MEEGDILTIKTAPSTRFTKGQTAYLTPNRAHYLPPNESTL